MIYPTVDLSLQRLVLTALPGPWGPSQEVFGQDLLARLLHLMGFERIMFTPDPPERHDVLWHDRGQTPTGKPGILKIWSEASQQWVPLTPETYRAFQSGIVRIRVYRTASALSADRPTAPREGDWWIIEDEGRSYMWVGPDDSGFWLDQTGAPIRVSADAGNAVTLGSDGGIFTTAGNMQTWGTTRPTNPQPGQTFVDLTDPLNPTVDLAVSNGVTTTWVQII